MLNEVTTTAPRPTLATVLQRDNLNASWLAVKANRGTPGPDGKDIPATLSHLKANWDRIESKLRAGDYRPGPVRSVSIPKANGGTRELGVPNVQDRLIQQAIHQKLSEYCEGFFSEYSYGFRPNRSAHDAVRTAQGYVRQGKCYVVDIDLKSFFDEVNHDKLMQQLGGYVDDPWLKRLIGSYLRAPVQNADGTRQKRGKGTPQGGPLSPLLANIYLHPLDKELEARGLSFVRYADDLAIFVSSQRAAERVLESVTAWIEKILKVPVNREKSGSGPTEKSALLGFCINAEGETSIAPKSVNTLKAHVRELWEARQNLTSKELSDQWQRFIRGWWNYFKLADCQWGATDLSGWIRRHIRKCFWLRWKTPRGRINALKKLGVKGRGLGIGYSGLGAWRVSRHWVMHQALSNKVLARYGFILPWHFAKASVKSS